MIEFYTKPGCTQCVATKRFFDMHNLKYKTIDVSENQEAADMLVDQGYMQLPVIITPQGSWTGFRPDKILQIQ